MQKANMAKLFSLLLISVLMISLFSTAGAKTYQAFFAEDSFGEGTLIGPVDISGLTKEDAKTILSAEIEAWYGLGQVSIVVEDDLYPLEKRNVYQFDIPKSVDAAINKKQNPLLVTIQDEQYNHLIKETNHQEEIKIEELKHDLLQPAKTLHPGEVAFNLSQYVKVDERNVISQALITNVRDESELLKWVKELGIVTLPANTPFSLLTYLEEIDVLNKYSNETLSVIATSIYSSVLPTNFDIVERHISNELPAYATFGNEALIEKEKKDLIIFNKNPYDYNLVFSLTEKGFEVQLNGAEMQQTVSISIRDEESFEPKIIKQYDSTLKRGQVVNKQKGLQGKVGKIYRIVKEKGQLDQKILLAQDYYPPKPVIEVHSILVPEEETQNPVGPEQNPMNPIPNPSLEGENQESNPQGDTKEENRKDNSDTDLWENPEPMQKS